MKWFSNRYTYPLVALVILITSALQLVWLHQLFLAQRVQIKRDLEQAVTNAARLNTYLSDLKGHEKSQNFRDFFLSPSWIAFQQAFNNIRFENASSRYNSDTKGDSTIIDISLRFLNGTTPHVRKRAQRFEDGETLEQITAWDKIDFHRMDSLVRRNINGMGQPLRSTGRQISFDNDSAGNRQPSSGLDSSAAYKSRVYSYNLHLLNSYQLSIPSIDRLVYYRMRYYLLSAILMASLTVAGFIFLLRLLRNQRLYSEARLTFTSNMTHELKTPVATVAVALETLMENDTNPALRKSYLEQSRNELRRLDLMIDKVLNLDIADSGRAKLRNELFDMQPVIDQVKRSMQIQIDQDHASINWRPSPEPCFVEGDPVHLTNIIYNLIENALKYGGGGVHIQITCTRDNGEIVISIKDNGPGIAGIYQARVFDRFFRVPNENRDIQNVKGSGLGLNYVKEMIERHNGRIRLVSELGKGSNFIIYLPSAS